MSDIARGVLSGGWTLIVGWILPTAINLLLFGAFVLPSLQAVSAIDDLSNYGLGGRGIAILVFAIVIGLMLNALQAPLYRILEGYLWPARIARKRRDHHIRVKHVLQARLDVIRLRALSAQSRLEAPEDKQRLADLSTDRRMSRFADRDQARTTVQRSLLRERLRRYPVDDAQVAPTRLGNAIRRFEEYGYDRYRLDSQALWYQLTAAAPKQLNQQIDTARAGVDFFVCLLYGQIVLAITALVSMAAPKPHYFTLLETAVVLVCLTPAWYRLAWVTTDDWALAVRALVELGRKPLAEELGLCLPSELDQERKMWSLYCRMVRRPYDAARASALDEFRVEIRNSEPYVPASAEVK